jgi:Coenzyme PQQ synthesis protein D (PqqD)
VSGNLPVRNPKLAWREIEGEIVIISPENSQLHELNETAALIWKQADGKSDAEQIAARLAEEFDVAPEAARADVTELLAQLEEKELLLVARSRGSNGNE